MALLSYTDFVPRQTVLWVVICKSKGDGRDGVGSDGSSSDGGGKGSESSGKGGEAGCGVEKDGR